MQALKLSAFRGFRWFAEGFLIFLKKPVRLALLVISYWMVVVVLASLPLVGQSLATLLVPAFSVSLMNAFRQIESGRELEPLVLFSGLKTNLRPLLVQGFIYFLLGTAIFGMVSMIDGGIPFQRALPDNPELFTLIGLEQISVAEGFAMILLSLVAMAFWYAPVLVAWHGISVSKALFFSFFACLRNWKAFALYVSLLMSALFVFGILLSAAGSISALLIPMFVFVALPTLYASFYVSYRDVFVTISENA